MVKIMKCLSDFNVAVFTVTGRHRVDTALLMDGQTGIVPAPYVTQCYNQTLPVLILNNITIQTTSVQCPKLIIIQLAIPVLFGSLLFICYSVIKSTCYCILIGFS